MSRIPDESELVEGADAGLGNMAWLAEFELLVLAPLVMNPSRKFRISMVGRYNTAPVFFLEISKFSQTLKPRRFMRIVAESESGELLAAFHRHVGRLSLLHQRVVAALLLHPQPKLRVPEMV